MQRQNLRLGIISDRPNHGIAKTCLVRLQKEGSPYSKCDCAAVAFDPAHPAQLADELEKLHAGLVYIGIPGRRDYPAVLHEFLDTYMTVGRKPVLGFITHDARNTRYVAESWSGLQKLPDGALSIIDAGNSQALRSGAIETALDLLLRNHPARPHTIPFTEVKPRSIVSPHEQDFIQTV